MKDAKLNGTTLSVNGLRNRMLQNNKERFVNSSAGCRKTHRDLDLSVALSFVTLIMTGRSSYTYPLEFNQS